VLDYGVAAAGRCQLRGDDGQTGMNGGTKTGRLRIC
jgi:hypothetical protein